MQEKHKFKVKHATSEKTMYEKLIILIDNKVYFNNMLFGKVF